MSRRRLALAALAAALLAYVIYLQVANVTMRAEIAVMRDAKARLDRFCIVTRWGIQSDRLKLRSSDRTTQERMVQRFYLGPVTHHDRASVATCLEELEPVPVYSAECLLSEDVACRVKIANDIIAALNRHYPDRR